jgi:peptide/nickel transport system permease protein
MALLFVLLSGTIDLLLHALDPRLADAQAASAHRNNGVTP